MAIRFHTNSKLKSPGKYNLRLLNKDVMVRQKSVIG